AIQHAVILRAISFTATPPTPIPALSLHDALPILCGRPHPLRPVRTFARRAVFVHNQRGDHLSRKGKDMTQNTIATAADYADAMRSEEHTSELQSRENLVCRLLLEKKK